MAVMTGGQALVQQLKREGVKVIFGLPGVQLDGAFDALYEERGSIRVIHARHEQATSYMADGYARSSGQVGACLVVPGPGLLNAGAGLATAYACSSPVLCIAGQINADLIGVGRGALHEINDQLEMISSVTKWAGRAMRPAEVPGIVNRAFQELRRGRPRPVEIEIPQDVLLTQAEVQLLPPAATEQMPGDPDLLEQAARALGNAQRPLIFAGGGILSSGAWDELRRLAELLEAPVIMTSNAGGALSDQHYLAQVGVAASALTPDSDVILAVGTRFLQPATAPWGVQPAQTVIRLDVDPVEMGRNHTPNIAIQADAKLGLAELAQRVQRHNRRRDSRQEELTSLKLEIRAVLEQDENRAPWVMAVRSELPEDGILVGEMTQMGYWSNAGGFPVYRPRTYITPGYQGTLGFGFPTALGVKVAHPDKQVVSINGDGGLMYNVQELATAALHKINVVAIVFNDSAFGNVKRIQATQFGARHIASDLLNPDFVKLAESFGIAGMRAKNPAELRACLREALALNAPALIEAPVGAMPVVTVNAGTWTWQR